MNVQDIIEQEESLTRQFDPESANTNSVLTMEPHYSLVAVCGENLRDAIKAAARELSNQDTELIMSPAINYHVTICLFPESVDPAHIKERTDSALRDIPLNLFLRGIHIRPSGIFVNAYSPDKSLQKIRRAVADLGNYFYHPRTGLEDLGWVTLARFSSNPGDKVLTFIQSKTDRIFGDMVDDKLALYLNDGENNKYILGKKIW